MLFTCYESAVQAAAFDKLPIQLEPLRAIIAHKPELPIQLFGN